MSEHVLSADSRCPASKPIAGRCVYDRHGPEVEHRWQHGAEAQAIAAAWPKGRDER